MNTRSRSWCFTTNNYSAEDVIRVEEVATLTSYLVYGKEIGEKGTPHLQGYMYFDNAKSFSKIQKIMPKGTHLEVAKGSADQASTYCKKDQDYKEFGTIPAQGKRNDISLIKDEITKGGGMEQIIEIATNYQTLRTAELLLKYVERKRNYKPNVVWIYGESGTGKTKTAYEAIPNAYRKSNSTGKWWDGYDGHEDVILDDLKDTSEAFYSVLLELTDRYDCRVEQKGSTRQFLGKNIYITSILHPKVLYSHLNKATEILRRIDNIVELKSSIS